MFKIFYVVTDREKYCSQDFATLEEALHDHQRREYRDGHWCLVKKYDTSNFSIQAVRAVLEALTK